MKNLHCLDTLKIRYEYHSVHRPQSTGHWARGEIPVRRDHQGFAACSRDRDLRHGLSETQGFLLPVVCPRYPLALAVLFKQLVQHLESVAAMPSRRTERGQQALSLNLVQGEQADAQVFGCLSRLQYDFSFLSCHPDPLQALCSCYNCTEIEENSENLCESMQNIPHDWPDNVRDM